MIGFSKPGGCFRPTDENPNHPAHRAIWSLTRTRFHRVVFNDWGTSRPPMAVKSKPPAWRVVDDSECGKLRGPPIKDKNVRTAGLP